MYDGRLPTVVTDMKHLQQHGPAGRSGLQALRPCRGTRRSSRRSATRAAKPTTPARKARKARKHAEYAARRREHKEELRRITAQHHPAPFTLNGTAAPPAGRFSSPPCRGVRRGHRSTGHSASVAAHWVKILTYRAGSSWCITCNASGTDS